MKVAVTCDCGCDFETPAELPETEIRCPACGKTISLAPSPAVVAAGKAGASSSVNRIPQWVWIGGGCLGVMGVLVAVAMSLPALSAWRWIADGQRQVDEEIALLVGASEPSSPEELEAYYRLPAEVADTADLWSQASAAFDTDAFRLGAARLPIVGESSAAIADPGQPWDALAGSRDLLNAYRPAMDQLHEAARLGGAARYEAHFAEGFSADNSVVMKLRVAAKMLKLEAHTAAHEENSVAAFRAIQALFRLAKSLENRPDTVSQLVRNSVAWTASETLVALLPFLDVSDHALAELMSELADDNYDQGLVDALFGERIQGLHAFEHPELVLDDVDVNAKRLLQWSRTWMRHDQANYLRHMRRLIAAAREPWPQKLDSAKRVGDDLERLAHDSNQLVQLQHLLSLLMAPAQDALFTSTGWVVALRDSTIVVLAVERYRSRHGQLPVSLDQLVPEFIAKIPLDPFDGQALRYRVDPDRYFVYSVSENRQDDGGELGPTQRLDVVLSVATKRNGGNPGSKPVAR